MLEFTNLIRIDRPCTDVFAFLADFENLPKWNYYVLDVRKLSDGPPRVGTRYHQIRKTDEQDFHITELEWNHAVTVQTVPNSSLRLEMRFTLSGEGSTTCLRDEWKLDTGGPALLAWLGAGRVQSAVAENLTKLKELLEAGQVVLQDGRHVIR
jgi:uncharacterized membrane protein